MSSLPDATYLSFPFRVDSAGPATSSREDHVKELILQVLFTAPGERVFRPEFGAGLKNIVMEPNSRTIAELTRKRMQSSLADALRGEVNPKSLEIETSSENEKLLVTVRYVLGTVGKEQQVELTLGPEG